MKRRTIRSKTIYFAGLNKANNELIVSTVRQTIAEHVGICARTLARHLGKSSMYSTEKYIIWTHVPITYRRTGFAIRSRY